MKWVFYAVVALYMLFRAVYGESGDGIQHGVTIKREEGLEVWMSGVKREILCIGTNKMQKLTWKDGNRVEVERRRPGNTRVYVQDRSSRGSVPVLALVFARPLPEDSGLWFCYSGRMMEDTPVCVMEFAEFEDSTEEVTTEVGRSITLSCQARGQPEPRIDWYRNDEIITDYNSSSKYMLMTKYNVIGYENLLTVSSLEPTDAGAYVCRASQEITNSGCLIHKDHNITINVNYPPTMVPDNSTETYYINDYDNITIQCNSEGFPTPSFSWYQQFPDHERLLDDQLPIITEGHVSTMEIPGHNMTGHDLEKYTCRATNQYGEAEKSFVILPLTPPLTPAKLSIVNESDTELTLNILWVPDADGQPFSIKGFKVQLLTRDQIPSGRPHRESDWLKAKTRIIDENIQGDNLESQIVLDELKPETKYWIRVRVYNDVGYSDWSKTITHTTLTAAPEVETTTAEPTETETPANTTEILPQPDFSENPGIFGFEPNSFYALVCGASMIVIVVGCTFIMKKM